MKSDYRIVAFRGGNGLGPHMVAEMKAMNFRSLGGDFGLCSARQSRADEQSENRYSFQIELGRPVFLFQYGRWLWNLFSKTFCNQTVKIRCEYGSNQPSYHHFCQGLVPLTRALR
jgi:hypothetical protein